jgi:hypothetical protein
VVLLGAYRNGKLRYFGHSGTGFSQKGLAEAIDRLRPFFTNQPPVKTVRICSGFPGAWLILVTETRRSIIDKKTGSCEGWDAPPVDPRICILARNLLRIMPGEFLLQVAAPRWINSRVQSDEGLDFR